MEQSEVIKRVVGMLTQAGEWAQQLEEGRRAEDVDTTDGPVTAMLNEVLAYGFSLPTSASHQEIAEAMNERWTRAVRQLVGAFTVAFTELAHTHDTGDFDTTSADVLRRLALRADEFGDPD
ncbi:hypothetical protein [Streptomyces hokutonensis]|uniref:hypothetical protein n=1 Tax=Streptomyces hokutonensis TaxID=1306990 RepID=UPI0004776262|nr:hypothetical protein [Streptomyces hokutonensis]